MNRAIALIAVAICTSTWSAEPKRQLNRCETPSGFAYWTPAPCVPGDRLNGEYSWPASDKRNFSQVVRDAEERLQELKRRHAK